jgi:heme-degrading monooxygenase HmoA
MFVILYRWRIKPEKETQFIEAWSEITAYYRENFASLGSRLHRGNDGIFYAYARWNSAEDREKAFNNSPKFEESFPEVCLEIIEDFWIPRID